MRRGRGLRSWVVGWFILCPNELAFGNLFFFHFNFRNVSDEFGAWEKVFTPGSLFEVFVFTTYSCIIGTGYDEKNGYV